MNGCNITTVLELLCLTFTNHQSIQPQIKVTSFQENNACRKASDDIASHLQANWEHVYSAPKHIINLIESKLMTKVKGINEKTAS